MGLLQLGVSPCRRRRVPKCTTAVGSSTHAPTRAQTYYIVQCNITARARNKISYSCPYIHRAHVKQYVICTPRLSYVPYYTYMQAARGVRRSVGRFQLYRSSTRCRRRAEYLYTQEEVNKTLWNIIL